MTESTAAPSAKPPPREAPPVVVCRLHPKELVGRRGPLTMLGEVELENLSSHSVDITYQMSPLQFLELVVTDSGGRVVSEGRFSDRFSPAREDRILRLQPNEKFVGEVPLLATVPRERRIQGKYRIQAVYHSEDICSTSEPLEVMVE